MTSQRLFCRLNRTPRPLVYSFDNMLIRRHEKEIKKCVKRINKSLGKKYNVFTVSH